MFFILKHQLFLLKSLIWKELKYFMEFCFISGMLFTIFWLSICTQQSSSDSLSDSVLSITTGTTQFALELLHVSNIVFLLN